MKPSEKSIQVPLLDDYPPNKKSTYLNTGFFDTYLLFWVGKFVTVTLQIYQ